jgi:UDP-galactopyranose mutase
VAQALTTFKKIMHGQPETYVNGQTILQS